MRAGRSRDVGQQKPGKLRCRQAGVRGHSSPPSQLGGAVRGQHPPDYAGVVPVEFDETRRVPGQARVLRPAWASTPRARLHEIAAGFSQ